MDTTCSKTHSRRPRAFSLLIRGLALCLLLALPGAWAEDASEGDSAEGRPSNMRPYSQAADLNMLAQVFGDVARAAAGQIAIADILIDPNDSGTTEALEADSMISAMMMIYLLAIAGFSSFMVFVMIVLMSAQSGISAKSFNDKYGPWTVIRVFYAFFAMLPVVGGWSFGQYAILKGVFIVNGVANEMNTISNQWIHSRGTAGSVQISPGKVRNIVETVYLAEICEQVNNRRVREWEEKKMSRMALLTGTLPEIVEAAQSLYGSAIAQEVQEGREKAADFIEGTISPAPIDSEYWVKMDFMDQRPEEDTNLEISTSPGSSVSTSGMRSVIEDVYYKMHWSSQEAGMGACGVVEVDFGSLAALEQGTFQAETLRRFQTAHVEALRSVQTSIKSEVEGVGVMVQGIDDSFEPSEKAAMAEELQGLVESNDLAGAIAGFLHEMPRVVDNLLQELINEKTGDYIREVRESYAEQAEGQASRFEDLLNEMALRQREGGGPDYQAAYETMNREIPEDFEDLIGPEYHALAENSAKGWMYFGFKWWDVSRASQNQKALQKHVPTSSDFTTRLDEFDRSTRSDLEDFSTLYARLKAGLPTRDVMPENADGDKEIEFDKEMLEKSIEDNEDEPEEVLRDFRKTAGMFVGGAIKEWFDFENRDLLSGVQNAGHNSLWLGSTILALGQTIDIWAHVTKEGSDSGVVSFFTLGTGSIFGELAKQIGLKAAAFLSWLGVILIAVGFLYAVYLPLLPAMIWTFTVVGWMRELVALIVIFPIWMSTHLFSDGQDALVNNMARQGYTLVAGVLLRPIVAMFAMSFSMVMMGAMSYYLKDFVDIVFASTNQGYFRGFLVQMGTFVVFSGFVVVLVHMILAWSYKIADSLPYYIGSPGVAYDEGGGIQQINAMGANFTGRAEQGAQAIGSAGSNGQKRGGGGNNSQFAPG